MLTHVPILQGEEKNIVVEKDDGIRPGASASALAALKPVFKKNGTTTAGNSSQVCCIAVPFAMKCLLTCSDVGFRASK